MAWQPTPHLIILFIAAIVPAGWALYGLVSLRRAEWNRHVLAFVVLNLAVAEWTSVYAIQVASTTLGAKLLAFKLLHVGGVLVPPAWFVFALAYTGRDRWLTPAALTGLAAVPVAFLLTLPTNPGSLAFGDLTLATTGSLTTLEVGVGPLYALFLAYSYVLLLAGGYVLTQAAIRQRRPFRGASALLLGGVAVPFAVNILEVLDVVPPGGVGLNYTPVSLAFSAFLFGLAVFRYRLFDLQPIARKTTFEHIREGIVVLDANEHVVDFNPTARELLGLDADAVGQPAATVVPRYAEIGAAEGTVDLTVDADETRFVEMSRSPLAPEERRGWLVLLRDVTAREARTREVERQNERLDAFAGIVAHDLRNPLNVISVRAELARAERDSEHFDAIERSVSRMETLLERLLTLSRRGERLDTLESVSLATVATEAWSVVDTSDATLTVESDRWNDADADALSQVFENLFRNALEHGGAAVAVRLGDVDGAEGFYVADDGPGIPVESRRDVFDHGYSTGGDGIGLGLSIVQEIVEAHGWHIGVTESSDGGARFEITVDESGA